MRIYMLEEKATLQLVTKNAIKQILVSDFFFVLAALAVCLDVHK